VREAQRPANIDAEAHTLPLPAARMTDMRAPHAGNATSRTPRAEPIGPAPFLHTLRFFVVRRAITANSADRHSLPDTVAIGPQLRDRATPPTTPSGDIAAAETCDASTSSTGRFDGFGSPAAYVLLHAAAEARNVASASVGDGRNNEKITTQLTVRTD